ncbi:MAG: phosphopantothenoylcysteine decarboxylase [Candidatus Bipolaricaulia bacterium]
MNLLKDRVIGLGVCGVSTAYKSVNLAERMSQQGAKVRVAISNEAKKYVTARTFKQVSGEDVIVETPNSGNDQPDISRITAKTDLTVIAPASFSFIGKLASGLGKGLLTKLVSSSDSPIVLAPSMNSDLYSSETVRTHLQKIKENGFHVVEPKPWGLRKTTDEDLPLTIVISKIISKLREVLQEDQLLEDKKILVTAAPTRDLLNLTTNIEGTINSSLGYSLSRQSRQMGGEVTLVSGPTEQIPPTGVGVVWTRSVDELDELLTEELPNYDLILMAGSASDWHPELNPGIFGGEKTKRLDLGIQVTPDLARKLGRLKEENQVLVEFRTGSETEEDRTHESLVENDIDGVFSPRADDEARTDGRNLLAGSFLFKSGDEEKVRAQTGSRFSREILREIGKRYFR